MRDCIFCKIINKEVPSEIIFEDENFVVLKDINPFGPVALLVISRKHINTIIDLEGQNDILSGLMNVGLRMVKDFDLNEKGFSFHINGGGVQEVNHLHLKIGGAWENREAKGYPKW